MHSGLETIDGEQQWSLCLVERSVNADIESVDAKHEHIKRVRFMHFNKMIDGRRKVGSH